MRASDGPSGADVAEVIARTIGALGRLDLGFLRADPSGLLRQPAGWLGDLSDAQIVLVEDAEAQAIERHAVAPELLVIVVPTAELGGLAPERLAADLPIRLPRRRPVRPDVVFTRARICVFVDGCFWHCCPTHGVEPAKNVGYGGQSSLAMSLETRRWMRPQG